MVVEASSFRDVLSGRVVKIDNEIYREIHPLYFNEYDHLINSGLYSKLREYIIPHKDISRSKTKITIKPKKVPFITYPYEWPFNYLKQAAINTLNINMLAIEHGMILKDASAFNMQRYHGKMTLIDTTSFAFYKDGDPWVAHRQFVQHFLIPLLIMKYRRVFNLSQLYLDGIPPKVAADLLPIRCKLKPSVLLNVGLQSMSGKVKSNKKVTMSKRSLLGLLYSLRDFISGLKYENESDWAGYDEADSYTPKAKNHKDLMMEQIIQNNKLGYTVLDIGANTGHYSKMASHHGYEVIATDNDHDCINKLSGEKYITSLVVDICNPTPGIGFMNTERPPFLDRVKADTVFALALIHHICIGNNVPLYKVAELFSTMCRNLVIEFVPDNDPKAKIIKGNKVIPPYSQALFESEFVKYFDIESKVDIKDSMRSIYLMRRCN